MHTLASLLLSSTAGPPAIMAIASSVVQGAFASILPKYVYFALRQTSRPRSHDDVEQIFILQALTLTLDLAHYCRA